MDDLIAFLQARLDEDERRIADMRAMTGEDQGLGGPWKPEGHDPVLVDIAAKRMIVLHVQAIMPLEGSAVDLVLRELQPVLQYLALPYSDHPDYQEAWRL